VFGVLALVLASVGLYGVMAYQVAARTGEIGVRMALGADRQRVLWMVLRQSLLLVAIGAGVGIPLALGGGRAIAAQLYGVAPWHPVTLVSAVAALFATGAIASLVPARRASRVDPLTAMR
jgi:ABC-type antimicrobial peptide transport system permease subunit